MTASRRRHLSATVDALRDVGRYLNRAEAQWAELAPGMRAQSLTPSTPRAPRPLTPAEQDEVKTSQISDPTGEAAVRPSAARTDENRVDELARSIANQTAELARILARWAVEMPLKATELAELQRQGDPGCEVVGRVERSKGVAYWEAVHTTTDYRGLLARPYRLGAWADQFVRRNGRLPTPHEAEAHCQGKRVMVKA